MNLKQQFPLIYEFKSGGIAGIETNISKFRWINKLIYGFTVLSIRSDYAVYLSRVIFLLITCAPARST